MFLGLISVRVIDDTLFEFSYQATLTNATSAMAYNVKAKAESRDKSIKLSHPDLKFGDVPANSALISRNLFKIRKTLATPFNPQSLTWKFQQHFAPVAVAGPDQSVTLGQTVVLDGSRSYNPDADERGKLQYEWELVTKPAGSKTKLAKAKSVNPSLSIDKAGVYTLTLTVRQEGRSSESDTLIINTGNSAPVADAGANQSAKVGTLVCPARAKTCYLKGDNRK